jgi:FkbM family methyltransferase
VNISTKLEGLKSILQFDNKWQLIINRLFFKSSLNIYTYKGMKILIDHDGGDACGTRLCLATDMYKKYLPHMSLPGKIAVLDLGANGGGFPIMLKAEKIMINKLVCVEMNPFTWQRLAFNIKSNFECESHCLNLAITGENKVLDLSLGKGSTSDSIFSSLAKENKINFTISCQTINTVLDYTFHDETIDVCKIDIEGAEYDVFLNPGHDGIRRCRYLLIEVHKRDEKTESMLQKELRELGFNEIVCTREDYATVYLFRNNERNFIREVYNV